MTTEHSANAVQPAVRARLHPLMAIAAVAVAAVSLIAAAQMLAPKFAQSRPAPEPVAEAKLAAPRTVPAKTNRTKEAVAVLCADCGVVVAVREVKKEGDGSGIGAVAGGVLGGVVGHQIGGGRGKDLATVAGAVGGAYAGHQVEKHVRAKTVYSVDVKMEDGSMRTITQAVPLSVGAKVRVAGDQVTQRG